MVTRERGRMSTFKLATWNVNSLRVRLPHVLDWLKTHQPDVLALQEIKLIDADFPYAEIEQAGYHALVSGQKTYNGVALLSREPMQDVVKDIPIFNDPQRRIIAATYQNKRILNLYVPNGESTTSDKYNYKLAWLNEVTAFLKDEMAAHPFYAVVGDFNIAPQSIDVHAPEQWSGHVLCSDPERQAFSQMLALGLQDCYRIKNPATQEFSWWDYRMNAFKRNIGLRIDHILASEALFNSCGSCTIDKTPRQWERPSDHAPVIAAFFSN